MGLILDSSPLIADERGKFNLKGFLVLNEEPVAIAAITASELLHGCYRTTDTRRLERRSKYVEWALDEFEIVSFGIQEARHYARLSAELSKAGTMIGTHDLMIAATAVSLGYGVATLNFIEFSRVPGLRLVDAGTMSSFQRS